MDNENKSNDNLAMISQELKEKPYSSRGSTPPGRLTLQEYNESLSRKAATEQKDYIADFEDWLL